MAQAAQQASESTEWDPASDLKPGWVSLMIEDVEMLLFVYRFGSFQYDRPPHRNLENC